MWGTTRAVVNNMVTGVSEGFKKELETPGRWLPRAGEGQILEPVSRLFLTMWIFRCPKGLKLRVSVPHLN